METMTRTVSGGEVGTQSWISEFEITVRDPSKYQVDGWIYVSIIHVCARN